MIAVSDQFHVPSCGPWSERGELTRVGVATVPFAGTVAVDVGAGEDCAEEEGALPEEAAGVAGPTVGCTPETGVVARLQAPATLERAGP